MSSVVKRVPEALVSQVDRMIAEYRVEQAQKKLNQLQEKKPSPSARRAA